MAHRANTTDARRHPASHSQIRLSENFQNAKLINMQITLFHLTLVIE